MVVVVTGQDNAAPRPTMERAVSEHNVPGHCAAKPLCHTQKHDID